MSKIIFFDQWANSVYVQGITLFGLVALLYAMLRYGLKGELKRESLLWSTSLFFIGILPVLTMYFVWMHLSENDRHGYLASGFFYFFVVQAICQLIKTPYIRNVIIIIIFSILLFFQQKLCSLWRAADEVYWSLIRDFRWYDKEEVYVISIPDHYRGMYMFRYCGESGSGLRDALRFSGGRDPKGNIIEISQFNMNEPMEGISAKKLANDSIQGEFLQWGNWWHRKCRGADSYENDLLKTNFDGQFVRSKIKNISKDHVIIYQVGGRWYELE